MLLNNRYLVLIENSIKLLEEHTNWPLEKIMDKLGLNRKERRQLKERLEDVKPKR